MSFRVLIVPEDFRKDEHMLQPIVAAMIAAAGKPNAEVRVCKDPLLGGIVQALNRDRIREILERYRWSVDLFLLCVDRDGNEGRRDALDKLEAFAKELLPADRLFLAENAWQEIEVWVLAGHDLPKAWKWGEIRQEVHPKERFFEPFARMRNVHEQEGGGREPLAREAAGRYRSIRNRCKEDVRTLEGRIKKWIDGRG